eukprot:TRINITY_DN277_c0_g1_i1.p1 TRINITY_DN277_c0_g1~~TRINITY_DN277_c0_g1_i1.p1  ORF type:complete len:204 (-),score=58.55 TRINITY_DN277_c0_g1_i1:57-668(-)
MSASPRLLVLDKGLGSLTLFFRQNFTADVVSIPEPADALSAAVDKVSARLNSASTPQPDLLVVGSRGARVAATLLEQQLWTGPVLAFCPMYTAQLIAPGRIITVVHGAQDQTIPLAMVQQHVLLGSPELMQLIVIPDAGHDLQALQADKQLLQGAVNDVLDRARQSKGTEAEVLHTVSASAHKVDEIRGREALFAAIRRMQAL